jgi:hypothetical protein
MMYELLLVNAHDVLPKHAELNVGGVETVVDLMEQTGHFTSPGLNAKELVDLEYLKAAGLQ